MYDFPLVKGRNIRCPIQISERPSFAALCAASVGSEAFSISRLPRSPSELLLSSGPTSRLNFGVSFCGKTQPRAEPSFFRKLPARCAKLNACREPLAVRFKFPKPRGSRIALCCSAAISHRHCCRFQLRDVLSPRNCELYPASFVRSLGAGNVEIG